MKDVPIATVATGITTDDGRVYVLVFNEVLYFGDTMDHTLVNPNQIRHYGVSVSNNPFDEDKLFGIDHDEVFVPFSTSGTTVYFESFYPTQDQMENCPLVILTSDSEWSPHAVELSGNRDCQEASFKINAVTRENRKRRLAVVETESDTVLESINGALVHDVLVERMISSVKIKADETGTRKSRLHKKRRINKVVIGTHHSVVTPERVADAIWALALTKPNSS